MCIRGRKETITGKEFMKIFHEVKGMPEAKEILDSDAKMTESKVTEDETAESGNEITE